MMETHIGKTVPIVKNFQIEERPMPWPPVPPLQPPHMPHSGPIYDSEMEAFLSRFSHQNQEPQQLLSCTITSEPQGYINCIPSSSSSNSFPYLSAWEASHRKNDAGADLLSSNLSFMDLLAMKDNEMANGGFVPGWNYNHTVNKSSSNGTSMFFNQISDILGGEIQGGSLHQYQSVCNANSPLKNINAKNFDFAPETPDPRWRIDSNMGLMDTTVSAYNQAPTQQYEFQEQDVAAAMINLQNVIDAAPNTDSSSNNKVSMTVENRDTGKEGEQAIDLNKTPQKKQRRRRYQPKVLSEKKPRKTPKPKTPKPTETTQVKKKHVQKNKVDASTTPPREATEVLGVKGVEDAKPPETAAKSCKKSLNFDLNGQAEETDITQLSEGQGKYDTGRNEQNDTGYLRQEVELVVEASRGGIAYDVENSLSLPTKDCIGNSQSNPDILSEKKENFSHNAEIILTTSDAPHLAPRPNSSPCASSFKSKNRRGTKRSNPDIGDLDAESVGPSNHASSGNSNIGELHNFLLPETCKKKRTEKAQRSHIPSTSFSVPFGDLNQFTGAQNHPRVDPSASKYYSYAAQSGMNELATDNCTNAPQDSINNRIQLMDTWADLARLKKKRSKGITRVCDLSQLMGISSTLPSKPGPKGPRMKIDVSENAYTAGQTAGSTSNPRSKRSKKQNSENNQLQLVLYNGDRLANKPTGTTPARPWAKSTSSIETITKLMKQLDISKESCNNKLKQRRQKRLLQQNAVQKQKAIVPYQAHKQEQNALVVYGRDGTMVPFDGPFDPVRKRRQRAKVDLDDETTKVWKLLLENIDNEGIDGTDEDKAKWWENERSVFRGRVDSFIARMRLVQGDRRFTPWKGSVLDSVIGVFLTQNVSDHLSSSAFMSLAAHFPIKSEGSESTLSEESATSLVGEPDFCIIELEESISWNEKTINQQIISSSSKTIHYFDQSDEKEVVNSKELTERTSGSVSPKDSSSGSSQRTPSSIVSNANSQTTASILRDDRARDDATSSQHSVISSQNSTKSPNQQTVGMMSIFLENDSRVQTYTTSSQSNYLDCSTSFLGLLKMAESPFLHETFNQTQQDSLECMNHVTENFPETRETGSSNYLFDLNYQFPKGFSTPTQQSTLTAESAMQHLTQKKSSDSITRPFTEKVSSYYVLEGEKMVMHSQSMKEPLDTIASSPNGQTNYPWKSTNLSQVNADVAESTTGIKMTSYKQKEVEQVSVQTPDGFSNMMNANASKSSRGKAGKGTTNAFDWDSLRKEVQPNGRKKERPANRRDSLDWEAVRHADVHEIAEVIKERGMNNVLAERIKDLLDRLVKDHGSVDMEWLRDIPPDKAKEYLLSFRGLGLKSVECVRLLTLHHLAFPVDTNVGRIAVRLGWVPLQPLPESLQLHLLELYPILESIQKYLWPRLCKLDQRTLYELHYHLITFGKVFCTKKQPNCNACPLRGECRHFASAFASARFALPGTEERSIMPSGASSSAHAHASSRASSNLLPLPPALSDEYSQNTRCVNGIPTIEASSSPLALPLPQTINHLERRSETTNCEPIVEVPASPEPEPEQTICDIEDTFYEDPDEIPIIKLDMKEFSQTVQNYIQTGESNALVALTPEAASIPTPKLKNINRLRTEHHVYELPDTHPLLKELDKREPDDPCSYLLAIWTPGETADSIQPPERRCNSEDPSILCNEETCSYCNSLRETNSQIVRGTLLIPCRTAMRGSFPLNGTYFQVNEVFADHNSSLNPIPVPRSWLWNLPRRTVYFGTSIPTIFRGLTTEEIQHCFWRGFVCVRGFDQKLRAPRPLMARLHFPASRMQRGTKGRVDDE